MRTCPNKMRIQFQPAVLNTSSCAAQRKWSANRIAYVPCQHHAANAQGDQRKRTIVHPVLEDLDHLLHDPLISGLDYLPAALDVGGHSMERAAAVAIFEVLAHFVDLQNSCCVFFSIAMNSD